MIVLILFLAAMAAFGTKHPIIGVTCLVASFLALAGCESIRTASTPLPACHAVVVDGYYMLQAYPCQG